MLSSTTAHADATNTSKMIDSLSKALFDTDLVATR